MRRKWCTMPLPTESTPAPSPWTPLPPFNDWAQWQLPDMAFKCLTLMIEEWITDAYCIMSLLSHIVSYVWQVTARWSTGKSCQRGTVWRARVTWSKGTLTWDWSFTDLTSVQNRSMCTAEKYSQGQLLRDVWGWTRHKKEKKRKSWRWNGVPDELSRSGELEETQHVFNAALILRRAIQSLQPITLFPAEPADLSEEKINVHVPSELHNFLSWIMTGKVQDMAPCLNKRVELDNCFLLMFFLDVLFNFLSFICVTEFSLACWYHFHVVHIAVMSKTYSYQKWNMDFFVRSFQSANPKFIQQYHVFFFVLCSISHACASPGLPQMISLFWWSLYSVYFDLSTLVSPIPF